MKLLTSTRLTIPEIMFISDRNEIKELPIGIPFIYGDAQDESYLIRILEYEVLYKKAIESGYPFNFKKILIDNGFIDIEDFSFSSCFYMNFVTNGIIEKDEVFFDKETKLSINRLKDFVRDGSVYVDIQKLKELNVFPTWLDKIEDAIKTNVQNFAVYNPHMYNKKLDGMYGGLIFTPPSRNLIIIDISSSIPRAVSSTCLTLSKNLAETFYADIMITGSITVLFLYEELYKLNIETIYEIGMGNEQTYYKSLVTSDVKEYNTVIAFGDYHSPCDRWEGKSSISITDGKALCKWSVKKLISFHTKTDKEIAGYAQWFSPLETEKISNWVEYLK